MFNKVAEVAECGVRRLPLVSRKPAVALSQDLHNVRGKGYWESCKALVNFLLCRFRLLLSLWSHFAMGVVDAAFPGCLPPLHF